MVSGNFSGVTTRGSTWPEPGVLVVRIAPIFITLQETMSLPIVVGELTNLLWLEISVGYTTARFRSKAPMYNR
jgi:hypothetical protein